MRPKKYRVKSLYISGRSRVFKCGDVVTQFDFQPGAAKSLCEKQYLEDLDVEKAKRNIKQAQQLNNPPKIAIVSAMWKRPKIFELFAENINHIKKIFSERCEIDVFISGSEGKQSEKLAKKHGFNYVEVSNNPLGNKMNAALISSINFNADYYIFLGSDDLFCKNLMDHYLKCMQEGFEVVQLLDCYFTELNSKRTLYWGGYIDFRKGKGVGAGRMLSSNIVEHFGHKLWAGNVNKGLDYTFDIKLREINYKLKNIKLSEINAAMLDLKNEDSITKFRQFPNSQFIKHGELKNKFKHLNLF